MTKLTTITCALFLATACGSDDDGGGGTPSEATVFAVSTDYVSTGVASTVAVPELSVTQNAVDGVASTDPVVRKIGDRIYVINRFGADNITILDQELTLVAQISTGAGSNPQDVVVVGDKLYVPTFAGTGLVILDVTRPDDGVIGSVDLSALDADDGIPNCNAAALAGDRLFVVCGILDDSDGFFTPRGPARIAVIDTSTDSLATDFATTGTNPTSELIPTAGGLLLDSTPNYGDLTEGCIERISTGDTPGTDGCVVDHADLGGIASGIAVAGDDLWIAVTEGWDDEDYQPNGKVHSFDLSTMMLASSPMTPDSQRAFDVARCPTGHLVVTDAAGGLRVYEETGTEITAEPLDIGLPPIGGGIVCY